MLGIGGRILQLRRLAGITCAELAQIAGVSRQYAHRIEQGKVIRPARAYLEKWAIYFNVDVQWLQWGQTDVKGLGEARPPELVHTVHGSAMSRRLLAAMQRRNIHTLDLARLSGVSPERIRAWLSAEVIPESVTAAELFAVSAAVGLSGHELLTGDPDEARSTYDFIAGQEVCIAELTQAMEAIVEALGSVAGLTPSKHAQLSVLSVQLLETGMDRASLLDAIRMASGLDDESPKHQLTT